MKKNNVDIPKVSALESELERVNNNVKFGGFLRSTINTLLVVAAIAILIAVFFIPVFRIYGSSMDPTLTPGDIVLSYKTNNVKNGDIIGFYYGSKLLVKRVIAVENQTVSIDEEGNVYIDNEDTPIVENYIDKKNLGETDIEFPYTVPVGEVFVMGDNRTTSIDSRSSTIGSIKKDEIIGKVIFKIWPYKSIGKIN